MVDENFEIQSFQMLQIDWKCKWFLHHGRTMLKFIPCKCSKLTHHGWRNFEIQSFQTLQIDSKTQVISSPWLKKILKFSLSKRCKLTQKRKWFLHYCDWRKFWNSVFPNDANWLKNASDFFTVIEENFEIQSFQMLWIDLKTILYRKGTPRFVFDARTNAATYD